MIPFLPLATNTSLIIIPQPNRLRSQVLRATGEDVAGRDDGTTVYLLVLNALGGNELQKVWSLFCKVVSVAQSDLQVVQIQDPYGPE